MAGEISEKAQEAYHLVMIVAAAFVMVVGSLILSLDAPRDSATGKELKIQTAPDSTRNAPKKEKPDKKSGVEKVYALPSRHEREEMRRMESAMKSVNGRQDLFAVRNANVGRSNLARARL